MAVEDLGTIRYTVEADHEQLDEATESTERYRGSASEAAEGNESLSSSFKGVATAVGIAASAIAGMGLTRIISETAKFEQQMLRVKAVSQATGDQFDQLNDQARTLGATTIFSAQQAAEAQQFLAQAGFRVNEVLSATPGVLELATAANIDLGQAADIASNALSGFQLPVDDLSRVNDVLANTAASANTSVSQLGQALSFAAPIATSAGVSVEQTAGAIGALSDAGLQASRAGTGLVGVIRQLSRVTPQAQETLASYGLSVSDVNVSTRGLQPVLNDLAAANITTADAFAIFGSEAGAAAQILTNTSDRVAELTEANQNATGAAEDMADTVGQGLQASLRSLNSAISEARLNLGDTEGGLGSAMQGLIDTATGVISVYNGMLPEFVEANNLTEEQAENLELVANGLNAVGGAVVAITAVAGAVKAATALQIAYNAAVRANPYVLLGTAITGAIGALVALSDNMDDGAERARELSREVEGLTRSYEGLTRAQLENERESLATRVVETGTRIRDAKQELEGLQELIRNSGQPTESGGAAAIATAEDVQRARELKGQIEDLETTSQALWQAYEKAGKRLEGLQETATGGDGGGETTSGAPGMPSQDDLDKAEQQLRESLQTQEKAVLNSYLDRQMTIDRLQEAGRISQEEADAQRVRSVEIYQDEMTRLTREGEEERQKIEITKAEETMNRLRTIQSLQGAGFEQSFSQLGTVFGDVSDQQVAAFTAVGGAFDNLTSLMKQGGREQFQEWQNMASAQAAISTALAVANAMAVQPTPVGLALAGTVAAMGAVQIAKIQDMEYQGGSSQQTGMSSPSFAGGGYTGDGSRTGGVDGRGGFPAILHPNETVIDHTRQPANENNGNVNQTLVFQVSGGDGAETARREIMKAMPIIREQSKQAVIQASQRGGQMSRTVGRRR